MTVLAEFVGSPWKHSHPAYEGSAFNMRPAPEFATGEVVLSSTYRAAGYSGLSESSVPANGRELDKSSLKSRGSVPTANSVSPDTWRTILHGALQSPKQPNQTSRHFLQLSPIIPAMALYSGSARASGNSWNPGAMVMRMIELGERSDAAADATWERLQQALGVGEDDDIWARWLSEEFQTRGTAKDVWAPTQLEHASEWSDAERKRVELPARQFTADLNALIKARHAMTRRQWISLLESILRIGCVGHVLWYCQTNDALWRCVSVVLSGHSAPTANELVETLSGPAERPLVYGAPALPVFRELASRYLNARLGLNHILHTLAAHGWHVSSLGSLSSVSEFLSAVEQHRDRILTGDFQSRHDEIRDDQSPILACKKGIGSNIVEFCRYSLGQRQSAEATLKGYDQGYMLRKGGGYKSAPWIVSAGPVAVLALVHCCLAEAAGPRSVQRLCEHVARYGVHIDPDEFSAGDLGRDLRMLNLVLDSPDAESGMLLVPPFVVSPSTR